MPRMYAAQHRIATEIRRTRDALLAPPRWWRELIIIGLIFGVYRWIQTKVEVWVGAAVARGEALLRAERTIHIDIELYLNHALAGHPVLAVIGNHYYVFAHGAVTSFVLFWLFLRHPHIYPTARLSLAVTTITAFVVFATVPTAPPRLLPHNHFVDTLGRWHTFGSYQSGVMAHTADQFAAMPSLHVAWSVWSTLYLLRITRQAWLRVLAIAYPLATSVDILCTANHYVLDVVGGLLVVAIGEALRKLIVEIPGERRVGVTPEQAGELPHVNGPDVRPEEPDEPRHSVLMPFFGTAWRVGHRTDRRR